MREASFAGVGKANFGTERVTYRNTSNVRPISAIVSKAKRLWRNKVAVELAERTGYSTRSAENWLAGHREMNGDALARLLSSDAGPEFLEALIETMTPTKQEQWRRELGKAAKRVALRQELELLETR